MKPLNNTSGQHWFWQPIRQLWRICFLFTCSFLFMWRGWSAAVLSCGYGWKGIIWGSPETHWHVIHRGSSLGRMTHISVVKISEVIQQLFIGLTGVGVSLLKKGNRRMFSFSRIPLLSFSEKVNIRAYSRWDFTYWSILNFRWKDAVFILVVDLEKLFSHVPWGIPWGGIQGYVVSGLLSQDIWVLYSRSGWWS